MKTVTYSALLAKWDFGKRRTVHCTEDVEAEPVEGSKSYFILRPGTYLDGQVCKHWRLVHKSGLAVAAFSRKCDARYAGQIMAMEYDEAITPTTEEQWRASRRAYDVLQNAFAPDEHWRYETVYTISRRAAAQ